MLPRCKAPKTNINRLYFWSYPMYWTVCLLLLYLLATSKFISGWVLNCDGLLSWRFYSAASLGHQATSAMTSHPTQSHYPDTEPTNSSRTLIMLRARLGSDKYQFYSHWFESIRFQTYMLQTRTRNLRIPWSSRLGCGRSIHLATHSDLL